MDALRPLSDRHWKYNNSIFAICLIWGRKKPENYKYVGHWLTKGKVTFTERQIKFASEPKRRENELFGSNHISK